MAVLIFLPALIGTCKKFTVLLTQIQLQFLVILCANENHSFIKKLDKTRLHVGLKQDFEISINS